jgi:serine/threonine protein kinase
VSLQPGEVFAGFTIVRELGAGGMGVVYLARHPRLPRQVALKLLRADLGADPSFVERFRREAEIVAELDHPAIVPVDDTGAERGRLWLSMPFIDGSTADRALADSPGGLPADRVVHIVDRVASALDFAHRRNLIHRDVKPANILLSPGAEGEPERVYLSDFGVAKGFGELEARSPALTVAGGVVATIDYAAPEQIEGRPLDGRCDVYALGCVLFKLLTGDIPFHGDNLGAKVYARLHQDPPLVSHLRPALPREIDAVVARALEKDRDKRFQTCRDLAAAVRGALLGAGGTRRPVDSTVVAVEPTVALGGALGRAPGGSPGGSRTGSTGSVSAGPLPHSTDSALAPTAHAPLVDAPHRSPGGTMTGTPPYGPQSGNGPSQPYGTGPHPQAGGQYGPPSGGFPVGPSGTAPYGSPPGYGQQQYRPGPASGPVQIGGPQGRMGGGPPSGTDPGWSNPPGGYPQGGDPRRRARMRTWLAVGIAVVVVLAIVGTLYFTGAFGKGSASGSSSSSSASSAQTSSSAADTSQSSATTSDSPSSSASGSSSSSPSSSSSSSSSSASASEPSSSGPDPANFPLYAALPRTAALSPTTIVMSRVVGSAYSLYTIDAITGKLSDPLLLATAGGQNPIITPDRQSIIYVQGTKSGSELRVSAADGSSDRALFAANPAGCPSLSRPSLNPTNPDQLAVLCTSTTATTRLLVLKLDGTLVKEISTGIKHIDDIATSPDGSRLLYWGSDHLDQDGGSLYTQASDGNSQPTQITSGVNAADAVWSPDGTTIVFREIVQDDNGNNTAQIATVASNGGKITQLTKMSANAAGPSWSPDGTLIGFRSGAGGDGEQIWVMNADGSAQRELGKPGAGTVTGSPAWGLR